MKSVPVTTAKWRTASTIWSRQVISMGPLVPITGTSGSSGASSATTPSTATGTQGLGQDAFLNLLVTQLKYQDPSQPMDNQAFISEMAQFQSLESLQQIQQTSLAAQNASQATEALSLVGKTVQLTDPTSGQAVSGVVSGVSFKGGVPQMVVNDQKYDLSTLTEATGG